LLIRTEERTGGIHVPLLGLPWMSCEARSRGGGRGEVSGQRGGESDQLPVTTPFEASIWGSGDGNKLLRNANEHEQPWPVELALARDRGGDGLGISCGVDTVLVVLT
jgi:hypothetical protein